MKITKISYLRDFFLSLKVFGCYLGFHNRPKSSNDAKKDNILTDDVMSKSICFTETLKTINDIINFCIYGTRNWHRSYNMRILNSITPVFTFCMIAFDFVKKKKEKKCTETVKKEQKSCKLAIRL